MSRGLGDVYKRQDMKWGEAKNYDLCINSSKTGVDGAIKLMKAYIEIKEANADK